MATKQSLRGNYQKIYEITNSFNKGYNTSVADDILNDSYFRDINNFLPSEEGNITKRPGINRVGLYKFFDEITNNLSAHDVTVNTNGLDASVLFDKLFNMQPYYREGKFSSGMTDVTMYQVFGYKPTSLANFTVIDDSGNLFGKTSDISKLLDNSDLYDTEQNVLSFILIFLNDSKYGLSGTSMEEARNRYERGTSKSKTLGIYNISITYKKSDTDSSRTIDILVDYFTPSYNAGKYNGDAIINLAVYNNNYYFMNGIDSIIKIPKLPEKHSEMSDNYKIKFINKSSSDLYKPTAIEVKNIGFNILSRKPMEYIDSQGSANSIRGVFYTFNDQPTQVIPYNKEFKIHILSSGSGENQVPEYRRNNGEVDEAINKYQKLKGSYNADKSIFTCTGISESDSIELRIKKGTGDTEDIFYAYFTMGSVNQSDIGKIEDISELILSSRYCKVINNQLVLYGNSGYIFFSDYDNFLYFPNYYYVYIAESENEEVVSVNYFRQYYAVFTNKRIKRMTGSFGSEDFGIYPLNDAIGCSNALSVKQVANYMYFLSYNGLYMLKQGYLGEGTENVDQIDLPIYKSYITDNMLKGLTFMNYYALFSEKESIYYNYVNDAYYKFKNASNLGGQGEITVNPSTYTTPFQYNKLQNMLFYGTIEHIDSNTDHFDISVQDFSASALEITDNGVSIVSTFETCYMSFNSPTNVKKFKEVYLKFYNKYGKTIPLYVTIMVDDKVIVSPHNYVVSYDKETDTYYYDEKTESNKTLKGHDPLGVMQLGEDVMGKRTMMVLKMKVRAKGRGIKIIVSDGIEEGNDGYNIHQNNYRFDLATIGVVYKLKKVKEV